MPRKIDASSWRYRLAQGLLHILYGRKSHYISPWVNVGIASGIIIHHNNNVLITLRAGNIEGAGSWSLVGGFLAPEAGDTPLTGLAREVKEEIGLDIDTARLKENKPYFTYLWHNRDFIEHKNYHTFCQYYTYELAEIPNIQCLDETADYKFITKEEFIELRDNGLILFKDAICVLSYFFEIDDKKTS